MNIGDTVQVFDRYRFSIPLKGVILKFSDSNDGVEVKLQESNSYKYPVGSSVWAHEFQLKDMTEKKTAPVLPERPMMPREMPQNIKDDFEREMRRLTIRGFRLTCLKYAFIIAIVTAFFVLLVGCSTVFSADFSLLGNGLIKRGNTNLTQYGISVELKTKNLEAKILSEVYSEESNRFWKHEATFRHEVNLNKKWSLLSSGMVGQDLKRKIDLQSKELITVMYRLLPWVQYGLGVGHRHKNTENDFLVAHHINMEKQIILIELYSRFWLYQWSRNYEYDLTLGIRHKLMGQFKVGFLSNYNRTSDYLPGVNPWDLSNKFEIIYNF